MDSNRTNEVVARVVAWHNRHPLARRITAAQVNSVGVVALPFVTTAERSRKPLRADLIAPREVVEPGFAPPTLDEVLAPSEVEAAPATKTSLAERAMARSVEAAAATSVAADARPAQVFSVPAKPWAKFDPRRWLQAFMRLIRPGSRAGFQSVFNEDFIAPLSPEKVARWALKYGNTTNPGDPDWPLREIGPDAAMQSLALATPGVEPFTLFLTAAAVDAPGGRLRLLLGRSGPGGTTPHVIGPRNLSPLRKAVAGALATVTLALAGWGGYWHSSQKVPPPEALSSSASVHADAASQAASAPAPRLSQSAAAPAFAASALPAASATLAAPSAPATSMEVAAKLVQRAPSAQTAAARTAPAPAVAPASAQAARAKPTPAPAPQAPPASSTSAHSLALEQHPSLHDAPKTINEMTIALHNKSWIPEGVKQAALLEGKRLRASAAVAAAHPKPAMSPASAPASAPDDGSDAHALPASAADKSAGKAKPALAAKPGTAGADAAAGPQYYALVTKPSASKLEAEARMILLRAAAANAIAPRGTRIELLQTQGAWQAVWWPFVKREDAERAHHLLLVRGVLVEMVAF